MKEYIVEKDNAKLRYHDLPGDRIPIIFIHGLGCASSFDYPQVASMCGLEQHRRLLVDLLGSGFSDKPHQFSYSIEEHADYLEQLINHLDIGEFFIYGHSMGGAISINLAARFDETRLKGLILSEANLDSGGGFFSKSIASYNEKEYLNVGHNKIIQESKKESNESWAASLSMSSPIAIYRESISLIEGQSPSWRKVLYSLKATKTFIFGNHSLPDPDLMELERENINIEIVPGAGHSMAWENPEGLATAITAAINLTKVSR
ncbi:alpha/beta fold hydrolase [Photobacterium chitinilyticum]|uniref:Alpha/beta hydrolase n=1 Tax=Photobacterium chitinilyticum TaxID=2485123 RepID=A0A444JVU7_9GAMM|nr:alpha/beta hydrolase [Photobacterium chitinilyticum]RWX57211.1 alpha/beta hydrolase [Photobacterium chitinilyticum]